MGAVMDFQRRIRYINLDPTVLWRDQWMGDPRLQRNTDARKF